jgi:hypothetical protein
MHFLKLNRPTGVRNSLVEQFVDLAARRLAICLANRSPSTVKLMHTFGKLKPARTSTNPKALHP